MIPKFLAEITEACESVVLNPLPANLFRRQIAPNETVVGTLNEGLTRLFAVREDMGKKVEATTRDLAVSCAARMFDEDDPEETPEHQKEHDEAARLAQKFQIVNQLFWQSLREEFSEATGGSIGVRVGGQVVTIKEEVMSPLLDLLLRGR